MNTENERAPARPTGRNYQSVDALMSGESVSQEVRTKVAVLASDTKIVLQLARLRQSVGMTQEDMANHLHVTQSAISKLESGCDDDITLRVVREYARATGKRISVMFGKPFTHVEAVKIHAFGIKSRLESLAEIANQNDDLHKDIKGFFSEAFFNILDILGACNGKLQNGGGDFDVKFEIIKDDKSCVAPNPKPPRGQVVA